jgi:hypothetical protein
MFTPNGDAVCKRCFYADDTRRKDSGATQGLISGGYAGIVVGIVALALAVLAGSGRAGALGAVLLASGVAGVREGRRREQLTKSQ